MIIKKIISLLKLISVFSYLGIKSLSSRMIFTSHRMNNRLRMPGLFFYTMNVIRSLGFIGEGWQRGGIPEESVRVRYENTFAYKPDKIL